MTQQPAVKKRPPFLLLLLGGGVLLCVLCAIFGSVMESLGLVPTGTASPLPSQTPLPSATLPPTDVPPPTATLAPIDQLRSDIESSLGDSNRNIPRLTEFTWSEGEKTLLIKWALNDNLSANLIMVGIQTDITDMLKIIAQSGLLPDYQSVTFEGTFSLRDSFGNISEEIVVEARYDKATVDRINWDGFQYTSVFDIADFDFIHPAMTP